MAEKIKSIDKETWEPKTFLGMKVKAGEMTSLEQVLESGKPVIEPEIMDILLPDME